MRALIVDDEPMPAKYLQDLIVLHCFEISYVHIITVASEAIEHLKSHEFDVLFLDIKMPEMDGFQFLNQAEVNSSTSIIFTTAYSDFAFKAFKVDAIDYLLKPYQVDELIKAVRKVSSKVIRSHHSSSKGSLSIYDGEQYHVLKEQDIVRLEADGSYTKIYLDGREPQMASKRIGHFESKLDSTSFFRCHHSHIVNISHIEKVSKGRAGFLTLPGNVAIPVSKARKEQLHQLLNL